MALHRFSPTAFNRTADALRLNALRWTDRNMRRVLIGALTVVIGSTVVRADIVEPGPIPGLQHFGAAWVSSYSVCTFDGFDDALGVIQPEIDDRLRRSGIQLLSEPEWKADPDHRALSIVVHCASIRWRGGKPVVSRFPSGQDESSVGPPYLFYVAASCRRRTALPGTATPTQSIVWSRESEIGVLGPRPFTELRKAILDAVDDFVAEVEKARSSP